MVLDVTGARERTSPIDRAEVSALWDTKRHGHLARQLQSEGMVHPRPLQGAVPDTNTEAGAETRPKTPSGTVLHDQLQRSSRASSAVGASRGSPATPPVKGALASSAHGTPWLSPAEDFQRQLHRMGVGGTPPGLQDAPGLRISKVASRAGASMPPPPSVPSNRSEAVRLAALLQELLETRGGTWEEQWRAHDAALAELVLQVGVHCAERGQLLQRIRKFFGSALRWSRNGDAAKQA